MRRTAILGLLAAALAAPADAAPRTVRLRWLPSASPDVANYLVYARPATAASFGAPVSVGVPPAGEDGALETTLQGYEESIGWVFAVAAVDGDGLESPRSNEIELGGGPTLTTTTSTTSTTAPQPCGGDAECDDGSVCSANDRCEGGFCARDPISCPPGTPCAPGRCDAVAGCVVEPLSPGSPCDSGDPCQPGACADDGTCVATAALGPGHQLSVSRFVLRAARAGTRLAARASFATSSPIDPTVSGLAFEVASADGGVLLAVAVPPQAFKQVPVRGARRRYRLARRAADLVPDVRRLVLVVSGDVVDLRVVAVTPALARSREESALRWVVRAGTECVRDLGIACDGGAGRRVCE